MSAIDRGARAERLLNDELMQEARAKLREALLSKIEASPVRDTDGREYLYLMLKASNDLWGYLEKVANDGKVEFHLKTEHEKVEQHRERMFASVSKFR